LNARRFLLPTLSRFNSPFNSSVAKRLSPVHFRYLIPNLKISQILYGWAKKAAEATFLEGVTAAGD
jgi:hypothetical protein